MASGYTQAQLDALQKALVNGKTKVEHDGSKVEYRSLNDLRSAIATVQAGLDADAGATPTRQVRFLTSKGV